MDILFTLCLGTRWWSDLIQRLVLFQNNAFIIWTWRAFRNSMWTILILNSSCPLSSFACPFSPHPLPFPFPPLPLPSPLSSHPLSSFACPFLPPCFLPPSFLPPFLPPFFLPLSSSPLLPALPSSPLPSSNTENSKIIFVYYLEYMWILTHMNVIRKC